MMDDEAVRLWRRQIRGELLAARRALTGAEQRRVRDRVNAALLAELARPDPGIIGFYWPIRGEIDIRPAVKELLRRGARAALPVITRRGEALEFAEWWPGMAMERGVWDIPVPADPLWLHPTTLLVATLGFDAERYRLGYGGGYYDRTLAALAPLPGTVGIAHELGRLETIFPRRHDIPLDRIVTEAAVL